MNQSLNENDEIEIKIGVKLFSSSTEIQTLTRNETKEGILVLSLLNRGHKLLLSLMLPQDHQNSEDNKIILSEWTSSELKKHGENISLMNDDWHHIDISFYQHKSFDLTVNNRLHRDQVIPAIFNVFG